MANITVSVDDDLKKKMDKHSEINWSEVARQSFKEKLEDLELMDKLTSDSELTEEDVDEISNKIDREVAERLFDQVKKEIKRKDIEKLHVDVEEEADELAKEKFTD